MNRPRHLTRWSTALAVIVLACTVGGGAALAAPTAAKPQAGGSLSFVGFQATPSGLDPLIGSNATGGPSYRSNGQFWNAIFGKLVYEDWATHKVVPWMAR